MDHTREVPTGATETKKNRLQGNIAELGNSVYQYGYRKTNPKKQ